MEDMFESIAALLIIVIPLLLKKKNSKKERPGQQKPVQQAAPVRTEKKIRDWIEQIELAEVLDEESEEDEADDADGMQPAYLEPEPLIPEMLRAERLQEEGLGEGLSRTDDFGCVGGSMSHPQDGHHQGEEFHSRDAHSASGVHRDEPMTVERVKPAVSAADLRKAVIWKEILDKPVSLRDQA